MKNNVFWIWNIPRVLNQFLALAFSVISDDLITFLDLPEFSKTFDNFDHKGCEKLNDYIFSSNSLNITSSYLDSRKQCAVHNGTVFKTVTISSWVPHGYVLGSKLFLICIADIPSSLSYSKQVPCADDTQIFILSM